MINDVKFWQGCCLSSLQTIAEAQEAVGLEQTMSRLEGVPRLVSGNRSELRRFVAVSVHPLCLVRFICNPNPYFLL